MIQQRVRLAAGVSALVLLSACGGDNDNKSDRRPDEVLAYSARCGLPAPGAEMYRVAEPTGKHCVGTSTFHVDTMRDEVFTEAAGDRRALQIKVWYPSTPARGAARAPYAMEAVYGEDTGWGAYLPWKGSAERPRTNAFVDAGADKRTSYPVILFSPGLGVTVELYSALTEDLASHGYIVVGINHPYVSGPTLLPNGEVVSGVVEEGTDELMPLLQADQRFVLDWLHQHRNDAKYAFTAQMDLNRVGTYGHSLGGATALQVQRVDPRVKAAVNLDGTVHGEREEPWTKPWMMLRMDFTITEVGRDPNFLGDDKTQEVWDRHKGFAIMRTLGGVGHMDFSDLRVWLDMYSDRNPQAKLDEKEDFEGMLGRVRGTDVQRQVRADVLDFLDRYVKH